MASDILTPSRRGFLGLFGAATAAATVAAVSVPAQSPARDWRTKPVAEWTQADFIAEAEFELAAHARKAKEVFHVDMSWHDRELYRIHQEYKNWWQIELMERQGRFV